VQHLELDEVREPRRAGEVRHPDGLRHIETPGRVGEQGHALEVEIVQEGLLAFVHQGHPAERHGDDLATGSLQTVGHELVRGVLPVPTSNREVNVLPLMVQGSFEMSSLDVIMVFVSFLIFY
jgi:hypothetical protein